MNSFFRNIAERVERRAHYNQTVRELSSLSVRDAEDLGFHPSQVKEIAYRTVYG